MDAKSYNLQDLVRDFLIAKRVEGRSKATLAFYEQNLQRIEWWLNKHQIGESLEQVSIQTIRAFLSYVQTTPNRWEIGSTSSRKPASMSTVDAYWRTLQAFFAWLVKEEIIKTENNPLKKIPRPKVPRRIIEDIPLPLIKKVINQGKNSSTFIKVRNTAIILVFLDTGIRLSACAKLSLIDIDPITGMGSAWEKGGQQISIHLGKTALAALNKYLELRAHFNNKTLWLQDNGKPLSRAGIQTMIRRLQKYGGHARWTPHTFRNTFAINILRAGGDPFSLQILGGWKDLEMPRRYTEALKVEDAVKVHRRASPADRLAEI